MAKSIALLAAALTAVAASPAWSQTVPTTPAIAINQNPLRSGSVTLLWPAASNGPATVAVYSVLGTPVTTATLNPDPGKWVWDGATAGGVRVTNGAYLLVVVRGDGLRMRRRLIVEY